MELKISRVTKQFSAKIAVDKVSLEMKPGVYGLLGANGAGKTTLLRMICGVLSPDSGEISLDRFSVKEEEYRNCLGYLPQEFGYYPNFTAWDFMMYMAALKGIPRNRAKVRIEKLLETVNLKGSEKKKIAVFSGGMKQRLGIAQALLNNPKLLVLDEPTAGLDPQERVKFRKLISRLGQDRSVILSTAGLDPKERVKFRNMISRLGQDRIVILSTHIVSDIEYIADEILLMKEGSILQKGSLLKFRNMISRLGQDRIVILSTHIVSDIEYIADEILLMKEGSILQKGSLPEILEPIQGKVWECKVNPARETQILEQYAVVNMREDTEGVFLRVAGEQSPSADAVSVEATLEDLYLYYFKGEGGE